MKQVLMDTGPLVAILSPDEEAHAICVSTLRSLHHPPITCWPVITEAMWLLRRFPKATRRMLAGINDGTIEVASVTGKEAGEIEAIMNQYDSLQPQFADAMLVYLAQRENIRTIFTLDRRDFLVYRTKRDQSFYLVPSRTEA